MPRRLPNLNALRAFEAAARRLSFSLAAEELFVTQGAVSRQIKSLETYLGAPLFQRLPRAIQLTDQGKTYQSVIRDAFDRIEHGTTEFRTEVHHKTLTVNVLPTFAMQFLIPRLHRFSAANPNIEVRMITSIRSVNFEREDVDVAIRAGIPPSGTRTPEGPRIDLKMVESWVDVRADLLMRDVLVPVCNADFLRKHGPFKSVEDFRGMPLLHNATRPRAWPDWFRAMNIPYDTASSGPAYGHFFMTIQAASEGAGIALIPRALMQADVRWNALVLLNEFAVESAGAYYILRRAYQVEAEHIRRFCQWLLAERDVFEADAEKLLTRTAPPVVSSTKSPRAAKSKISPAGHARR
jgi:LysR family glycine cleavage system transcriptional activator